MDKNYVTKKTGKQMGYTGAAGALAIMVIYAIFGDSLSNVIFAAYVTGATTIINGIIKIGEKLYKKYL